MLRDFFSALGSRLYKENALSDITWALCLSSNVFKNAFLKFFFKNVADFSKATIQREYSKGESRPDFWIKNEKHEYIIECKIYDRNDHFEQYQNDFPNTLKGYITNYRTYPRNGYEIRTWKDFKAYLEKILLTTNNFVEQEKDLLNGYIGYLATVCSIIKFTKMKLTNLKSLLNFNLMLNQVIAHPFSDSTLECQVNGQAKGITDIRSGKYFTTFKNKKHLLIGDLWFGVYYGTETIYIEAAPHPHEMAIYPILNKAIENGELKEGETFEQPYKEEGSIWFEIKKILIDKFNAEATTLEEQEQMLESFFQEVVTKIDYLIVWAKN